MNWSEELVELYGKGVNLEQHQISWLMSGFVATRGFSIHQLFENVIRYIPSSEKEMIIQIKSIQDKARYTAPELMSNIEIDLWNFMLTHIIPRDKEKWTWPFFYNWSIYWKKLKINSIIKAQSQIRRYLQRKKYVEIMNLKVDITGTILLYFKVVEDEWIYISYHATVPYPKYVRIGSYSTPKTAEVALEQYKNAHPEEFKEGEGYFKVKHQF